MAVAKKSNITEAIDRLDKLLERLNQHLKDNPIKGLEIKKGND